MSWLLAIMGAGGAVTLLWCLGCMVLFFIHGISEILEEPFRYWTWRAYFAILVALCTFLSVILVMHEVIRQQLGV